MSEVIMTQLGKFDDAWLVKFRDKSKIPNDIPLTDLRNELRKIGQHYRHIIETTPCDLKGRGELGRLFSGDWIGRYPSQSEADLALIKLLLPITDSP